MKNKKIKPKTISFIDCHDGRLVEIIGDKDKKGSTMFVVYKVIEESVEVVDQVDVDGERYIPPFDDLIGTGTILPCLNLWNLKELMMVIDRFIYRYLDISDAYRKLSSYYILLSWIYDCFETIPYLRALGDMELVE